MADINIIINNYKDNVRKLVHARKMLELLELYSKLPDDVKASTITDMPMSGGYGKKLESFVMKKEKVMEEILKRSIYIKELELSILDFEQKFEQLDELERFIIDYQFIKNKLKNEDLRDFYREQKHKVLSKNVLTRTKRIAISKLL